MPDAIENQDPFNDDETRDIERRMNIHRLKSEASEIAGGEILGFESPDLPPEIAGQFWQNVVAFEKAPRRSALSQLEEAGISMLNSLSTRYETQTQSGALVGVRRFVPQWKRFNRSSSPT